VVAFVMTNALKEFLLFQTSDKFGNGLTRNTKFFGEFRRFYIYLFSNKIQYQFFVF